MKQVSDEQIDNAIGLILRTGVITAAALVAAGGGGYLLHGPSVSARGALKSAPAIIRGAAMLQPLFIVQLGLLVLMATPIVRVIACAIGFSFEKDWTYVVVSMIVLGLLLVSLI